MQISAILLNLFDVATSEGYLPEEFNIGADNTYKETTNQSTSWFAVWLLCVLEGTSLTTILCCFLMVGHTHDALDRFFSRLVVALRLIAHWCSIRSLPDPDRLVRFERSGLEALIVWVWD